MRNISYNHRIFNDVRTSQQIYIPVQIRSVHMKKYIIGAVLFILLFAAAVMSYNYLSENYTSEGLPVSVTSDEKTSFSKQTEISISTASEECQTKTEQTTTPTTAAISENTGTSSVETKVDVTEAVSENTASEQTPLELQTDDFTVYNLDGQPVNLSDFLGKPIVVNFWSTWCESCVDELPLFEKLYSEYKNSAAFLMINVPMDSNLEEKVNAFIDENGYTFPVYCDLDFSAADAYGVWAMPQSLFINKEGELVQSYNGELSEEKLFSYFNLIK